MSIAAYGAPPVPSIAANPRARDAFDEYSQMDAGQLRQEMARMQGTPQADVIRSILLRKMYGAEDNIPAAFAGGGGIAGRDSGGRLPSELPSLEMLADDNGNINTTGGAQRRPGFFSDPLGYFRDTANAAVTAPDRFSAGNGLQMLNAGFGGGPLVGLGLGAVAKAPSTGNWILDQVATPPFQSNFYPREGSEVYQNPGATGFNRGIYDGTAPEFTDNRDVAPRFTGPTQDQQQPVITPRELQPFDTKPDTRTAAMKSLDDAYSYGSKYDTTGKGWVADHSKDAPVLEQRQAQLQAEMQNIGSGTSGGTFGRGEAPDYPWSPASDAFMRGATFGGGRFDEGIARIAAADAAASGIGSYGGDMPVYDDEMQRDGIYRGRSGTNFKNKDTNANGGVVGIARAAGGRLSPEELREAALDSLRHDPQKDYDDMSNFPGLEHLYLTMGRGPRSRAFRNPNANSRGDAERLRKVGHPGSRVPTSSGATDNYVEAPLMSVEAWNKAVEQDAMDLDETPYRIGKGSWSPEELRAMRPRRGFFDDPRQHIDKVDFPEFAHGGALARGGASSVRSTGSKFLGGGTMGRADHVTTEAPSGSYILPADILSGLGEGNSIAGARVISEMLKSGPWGTKPVQMGRGSGPPRAPGLPSDEMEQAFAKGGEVEKRMATSVPVLLSDGEYQIGVPDVVRIGGGSLKRGHKILDAFVLHQRKKTINKLKKLPGPVKS